MLSICMIAYNHEKFISEAIESVLMQKTSFDYELVIGEDCSTDTTRKICLEYQQKYPEKIKLLLPEKNLGMMPNFIATLQSCTGKYIALCEGDDYWTDEHKLQKQVDFLEVNLEYAICFTDFNILEESILRESYISKYIQRSLYGDLYTITIDNHLKPFLTQTCTAVFRNSDDLKLELNEISKKRLRFTDVFLFALLLRNAMGVLMLNYKSSIYRIHPGGVWSMKSESYRITESYLKFDQMNKYFKTQVLSIHEFSNNCRKAYLSMLIAQYDEQLRLGDKKRALKTSLELLKVDFRIPNFRAFLYRFKTILLK